MVTDEKQDSAKTPVKQGPRKASSGFGKLPTETSAQYRGTRFDVGCEAGGDEQARRCRESWAEDKEEGFKDRRGRQGRACFNCCRRRRGGERARGCP